MKRMILVGTTYSGKTTLAQYLHNQKMVYRKTQAVQLFGKSIIDMPGEYLELRALYRALIVTSVDADVVALVQSAVEDKSMFAPEFASMFNKPTIGIVTKIDLASEKSIENSIMRLELAGAERIFRTSTITGEGMEELAAYLADTDEAVSLVDRSRDNRESPDKRKERLA
ncbi:MAG TPA: EutP/PduV family microcompartment system protein [Bacillota bacterium]|nr:EutP/PduV family microcompartment system protein [Bacillota bacterium]